jgi:outer membrane protein assembly factor BamB
VLWSSDQPAFDNLFPVGDGVGWSRGNRAGVIDAATGAPLWTAVGDDGVNGLPVTTTRPGTAFGTVDRLFRTLIADYQGRLLAHQPADGRLLWSHRMDSMYPDTHAPAPACVGDLLVYTDASSVTAIEATTGALRWREFVPPGPRLRTVAPGCLVVSHPDGSLLGLHPSTGRKRWSWYPGAGPAPTGFVAGDPPGTVHLLHGESLHVLDTATGAPLWSRHVGEHATVPFVADGIVITATYDPAQGGDAVTAIAEHSGQVMWQKVVNRRTQNEADTACGLQLTGVHGGLLYVKSAHGGRRRLRGATQLPFVTALDVARGKTRWLWEHPGLDRRPAMLHGTTLLVQIPYLAAVALPRP